MGTISIAYPWLTVQRHLKGKHNQKEHGRRGGATQGTQLELFDRDQYFSQEWADQQAAAGRKKDQYQKLGLTSSTKDDADIDELMDDATQVWNSQFPLQYPPDMDLADFVDSTFNHKDAASGLETRVETLNVGGGTVQIKGRVFNEDGREVGKFERNIEDGVVDHSYFALTPGAQGKGFGAKYYKHLEESYLEAGLTEITIHANIDVGGYAWAKMGYDFQDEGDRFQIEMYVRQEFEDRYSYDPDYADLTYEEYADNVGWPYSAWEFAAFTGPDGARIGKSAMLGTDWMAYKTIQEGDPGWEAGQAYYESKGL